MTVADRGKKLRMIRVGKGAEAVAMEVAKTKSSYYTEPISPEDKKYWEEFVKARQAAS